MTDLNEILDRFGAAVLDHIENYSVPQYGDYPDDEATGYDLDDIVCHIRKYARRHGKNARPGQDALDMIKIGNYAGMGLAIVMMPPLELSEYDNLLSHRGNMWRQVSKIMTDGVHGYVDETARPDVCIALIFECANDLTGSTNTERRIDHIKDIFAYSAIAWSQLEGSESMIRVKKLSGNAILPAFQTSGSVGADLYAIEYTIIYPSQLIFLRTGIAIEIPEGFEGQVRPRSSMAAKRQLLQLPAVGTIDQDYRGEIMVPLKNLGEVAQVIKPGDRIAQLVISPVVKPRFTWSKDLSDTDRGENGFGSTGR